MTDKKMTGKAPVSGGFDLDAFVGKADGAGEAAPKPVAQPVPAAPKPVTASVPAVAKPRVKERKRDFRTEQVQFRLTPAELTKLKNQAGLIPVSTFLRKLLEDQGLI